METDVIKIMDVVLFALERARVFNLEIEVVAYTIDSLAPKGTTTEQIEDAFARALAEWDIS